MSIFVNFVFTNLLKQYHMMSCQCEIKRNAIQREQQRKRPAEESQCQKGHYDMQALLVFTFDVVFQFTVTLDSQSSLGIVYSWASCRASILQCWLTIILRCLHFFCLPGIWGNMFGYCSRVSRHAFENMTNM